MPQQGYSIGRDTTVTIITSTGAVLRMGKVTKFAAKPVTTQEKVKGIDGVTDNLRFHEGWQLSWETERRSSDLDDYWAGIEANYFAGIDEPPVTVVQTIQEPSGAVTQWRYERTVLNFDDAGTWTADKSVQQTLSAMASKRIKQA